MLPSMWQKTTVSLGADRDGNLCFGCSHTVHTPRDWQQERTIFKQQCLFSRRKIYTMFTAQSNTSITHLYTYIHSTTWLFDDGKIIDESQPGESRGLNMNITFEFKFKCSIQLPERRYFITPSNATSHFPVPSLFHRQHIIFNITVSSNSIERYKYDTK